MKSSDAVVKIVEVGPRDGLQNEAITLTVEQRLYFIQLLSQSGLKHIEVGSFVSPEWVPQMANTEVLFQALHKTASPISAYSALVPNERGMASALTVMPDEIAVFTSASEMFCKNNINCSIKESLARFQPVISQAKAHQIPVRGYLSCVLDCPYEGPVVHHKVLAISKQLIDAGCYEVSLGDTIGTGTPHRISRLLKVLQQEIPLTKLAVHFHDTYGQAIANIYAALELGIRTLDSACAGLGGCPYAKGASGNVATEDVIYLLNGLGLRSGVDLNKLVDASDYICQQLDRKSLSKAGNALSSKHSPA